MKVDIGGQETFAAAGNIVWDALNDPATLKKCIPGCKELIADGEDRFRATLSLRVASVGGDFEGTLVLSDKAAPARCRISVTGSGTLGQGEGTATFSLAPAADGARIMTYTGEGEIGGLVAGVGQRILKGVTKHLVSQFFKALRSEIEARTKS